MTHQCAALVSFSPAPPFISIRFSRIFVSDQNRVVSGHVFRRADSCRFRKTGFSRWGFASSASAAEGIVIGIVTACLKACPDTKQISNFCRQFFVVPHHDRRQQALLQLMLAFLRLR